MPNNDQSASLPSPAGDVAIKICPGCGCEFHPGGRGMGKNFHSDECRKAFHAVHRREGFPIVHLVKAWTATRHAKPGTREAAICTFARGQITEIARSYLDGDEEEGRDVVAYVGGLMDSGILFADRQAWSGR